MPKSKGHVKPTKEELEQKTQEAIEEAEKLKDKPPAEPSEPPEEPEPSEPVPSEPAPSEPEPSKPEAEPSKELYKKKFSESSREAQKLYAKNRVINKALIEADEILEPTEEELAKEFGESDWEMMSEVERKFAKETVISRRWRKKISEAKEQATKIEKWNDSVDEFVGNPQTMLDNPELEGKQEEFAAFAKEEANNSVPFKILVSAFLHEHSASKKPHKGRMFETGSGGPNDKPTPKTGKITLEEARKLRETNYNKYKEYLKAGRIEPDL